MTPFAEQTPEALRAFLAAHGGDEAAAFATLARPVVERYLVQTRHPPLPEKLLAALLGLIWLEARRAGLPAPLQGRDKGEARELTDSELVQPIARVLTRLAWPETVVRKVYLVLLLKQFFKGLLQPEFTTCRLSYQHRNSQGQCARQQLDLCLSRISGANCEDCPLWSSLTPERQVKVLKIGWHADSFEVLEENREAFLPGDYRELRRFLRLLTRHQAAAPPAPSAPPPAVPAAPVVLPPAESVAPAPAAPAPAAGA